MKGSTMSVSCVKVIQLKIDIASVGFWRKRRGVSATLKVDFPVTTKMALTCWDPRSSLCICMAHITGLCDSAVNWRTYDARMRRMRRATMAGFTEERPWKISSVTKQSENNGKVLFHARVWSNKNRRVSFAKFNEG